LQNITDINYKGLTFNNENDKSLNIVNIDDMEYSTDVIAQENYVTSGYVSEYPTTQSDTYVKATTYYNTSYYPHFATNPDLSLIDGHNLTS
jgi:hypothetical protein